MTANFARLKVSAVTEIDQELANLRAEISRQAQALKRLDHLKARMAIQGQLDEFDALDFHEIPGVKGLDQEIGKLRILLERRNEQIARLEDNNTVLIKENKRLIDRVLSEQKHTVGSISSFRILG